LYVFGEVFGLNRRVRRSRPRKKSDGKIEIEIEIEDEDEVEDETAPGRTGFNVAPGPPELPTSAEAAAKGGSAKAGNPAKSIRLILEPS